MGSYTPVPQSNDKNSKRSQESDPNNEVKVSLIGKNNDESDDEEPNNSSRDIVTVVW